MNAMGIFAILALFGWSPPHKQPVDDGSLIMRFGGPGESERQIRVPANTKIDQPDFYLCYGSSSFCGGKRAKK